MSNPIPIDKLQRAISSMMRSLPAKLGAEVVRFSKQRFREQGWVDNTFQPWQRRAAGAKRNKGRAILVDKGRLRRSIRVVRMTGDMVVVGTDVPYARAHNSGFAGSVTVKAHTRNRYGKEKQGTGTFSIKTKKERQRTVTSVTGSSQVKQHTRFMKMPKRQFLGDSVHLRKNLQRIIAAEIMKAVKLSKI